MPQRPTLFGRPMTPAERQQRARARERLSSNPKHIAFRASVALDRLLLGNAFAADVHPAIADEALALIARAVAKRRKALAPALAEYRRKRAKRIRRARTFGVPAADIRIADVEGTVR
jgi:hypothetical protein